MASPTAAYSIRLRVRLEDRRGSLGRLVAASERLHRPQR
jgi:hypothetical protein